VGYLSSNGSIYYGEYAYEDPEGQKESSQARRTGETMTAIPRVIAERGLPARTKSRIDRKRLAELLAYFNSLPKFNEHLTDEEIIGYDAHGLP
jgi:antitoxin VapB